MEWGRGVSAEMKLVRVHSSLSNIICRRPVRIGVRAPGGKASSNLVSTRVSASARIFKHLIMSVIKIALGFRNLDFKLEKINKNSDRNCKKDIFPVGSFYTYGAKHHSQNNQYKCMTPNKFKDFQSTIKGFLEFMNGRNLHRLFVFFLHTFIVPTKFLKSNVFLRKKEKGLTYCVTYLAILNYVKYSTKKIERQTNKLSIGYYYDKLNKSTNYGYMS